MERPKPYFYIEDFPKPTPFSEDAIRAKMRRGELVEGNTSSGSGEGSSSSGTLSSPGSRSGRSTGKAGTGRRQVTTDLSAKTQSPCFARRLVPAGADRKEAGAGTGAGDARGVRGRPPRRARSADRRRGERGLVDRGAPFAGQPQDGRAHPGGARRESRARRGAAGAVAGSQDPALHEPSTGSSGAGPRPRHRSRERMPRCSSSSACSAVAK